MNVAGWILDVAALVLVAAGAMKLVEPGYTVVALRAMGLPSSPTLVRIGAAAEAALGATALVARSSVPAALIALSFAAFTTFVLVARRRAVPISSCGCFGVDDTPPTSLHAAVTALLAVGSTWAVLDAPEPLLDAFDRRPGAAAVFALTVVLGAAAVIRVLVARPFLRARR